MAKYLYILIIGISIFYSNLSHSGEIIVTSIANSGDGSLRDAISEAESNDTIIIAVKGTIFLDSPIDFFEKNNLTIIGPYPKHLKISPTAGCAGNLFNISLSSNLKFLGIGFDDGNSNTRQVRISNNSSDILFQSCLFQDNAVDLNGPAAEISNSTATFSKCSFIDNSGVDGGAMYITSNANVTVINCSFIDNSATSSAGALYANNGSTVQLLFCSIFNNSAAIVSEAIRTTIGTTIYLENCAIAFNGGLLAKQLHMEGDVISNGGNCIRLNLLTELTDMPAAEEGDYTSFLLFNSGLRSEMKEDGFGLKYYPIISPTSTFVNRKPHTETTPLYDGRNAPRILGGGTSDTYFSDAGAIEYSHLRVTSNSPSSGTSNSLGWAILPEQRKDTLNYIEFDLSSPTPLELMSLITLEGEGYIIDGYSQPNSVIPGPSIDGTHLTPPNLPIDINNPSSSGFGITLETGAENSVIQGVRIRNFESSGIEINTDKISVYGCEIGIDNLANEQGNGKSGIRINSDNNHVGGRQIYKRNTLSGNGLDLDEEQANLSINGDNNLVFNTLIGCHPNGTSPIVASDTTEVGLYLNGNGNIIGLAKWNGGNVISKNKTGILATKNAVNNYIRSNHIGTDWNGIITLGNSAAGIHLNGAKENTIGGLKIDAANIITNNDVGIALNSDVTAATNNLIIGNRIFNNTHQGIDLEYNNIILDNDGLINATEQNFGLDFPELIKSESCDSIETITTYQVSVPAGENYLMEFFSVSSPDPTNGEGEFIVGRDTITVTSNPQTFTFNHGELLETGLTLTATITQIASKNTSEFGTNVVTAIIEGDPSFLYEDICPFEDATPIVEGDLGGSFRFLSDPLDGATINPTTGIVSDGIEGSSYTIIYGFPVCTNEDTTTFTVTTVQEEFSFPDFCVIGDEAGSIPEAEDPLNASYSLIDVMDDAVINSTTGLITNPTEGTIYTVINTVSIDGCTEHDTLTVEAILVNETFEIDDFCFGSNGLPYDIADASGTFSFSPDPMDGVIINDDGEILNAQENATYFIKYLVSNEGCTDSLIHEVNVITPNSNFTFDDFCPGDSSSTPIPEEVGGVYSFETLPDEDESIDPVSGIILNPVEGTTYRVIYENYLDECAYSDTVEVHAIEVNETFTLEDFCWESGSDIASPESPGGSFSFGIPLPADGASINPTDGQISGATENEEYTVKHTITTAGCTQSDSLIVLAIGVDESFIFEDFCPAEESPAPIVATEGGTFSFGIEPTDDESINELTGVLSNTVEGTTYNIVYTVTDLTGSCTESSHETVNSLGIDESFSFDNFCAEFSGIPSDIATAGGVFSLISPIIGLAEINSETGVLTGAEPGANYKVSYTVGECFESDTITVFAKGSDTALFTYSNFCQNLTGIPEISGTIGGFFDLFPLLPEMEASINASTGEISSMTSGDLNVRYISPGSIETCQDTLIQTVSILPIPKITSVSSTKTTYCDTKDIQPINIEEYSNLEKVYWYTSYPAGIIVDSSFSYIPDTLILGSNIFYFEGISAEGCYNSVGEFSLFLSDTSGMKAGEDQKVCLGSPVTIEAFGGNSYYWNTTVPITDPTAQRLNIFSLNEQHYPVEITNIDGCIVNDTVKVSFKDQIECQIDIYNAFSPNEDGKNDFWYIEHLINYMPNTVYIYNRWGNEVNRIENYDNLNSYWSGKDKWGNDLAPDTYYYVVITENEDYNQAGWVQIVR
ncbi:T9SS type B sorting domain-containing protein [Crocinitomix algicola]|uniref:T9SS type B sorting domain-containing protein n=1 Tax=Crocinitomix algicola TaxID=1740263 RepID=UPI00082BFE32|nr:gliding motility-associated C-terminal domain-containing protein [Crocinitomix algicola]